jgi:hypothetical protein
VVEHFSETSKEFETHAEPSVKQRRGAKACYQDRFFVRLQGTDTFVCKQKTRYGILERLDGQQVRRCLVIYDQLARLESDHTYDDFRMFTTTRFTTKDGCFPCKDFADKQTCYHIMAAHARLGLLYAAAIPCDSLGQPGLPRRGRPSKKVKYREGEFRGWRNDARVAPGSDSSDSDESSDEARMREIDIAVIGAWRGNTRWSGRECVCD